MADFKVYLSESSENLISYDFDGVLHISMWPGTIHPVDYENWQSWEPYEMVHRQLREDAKQAKIVVVSKRDDEYQKPMWDFIRFYKLPVEQIYTTSNMSKRPILLYLGAIRHYDDDIKVKNELRGTDIEFVLIRTPLIDAD